ncbi:MAG: hypothetical protein IT184_11805 [Acidobacteria bacterium]|nr:hypothetical protein [Acidobacteriota bacterium]
MTRMLFLLAALGAAAGILMRWMKVNRQVRDAERRFLEEHEGPRWRYRPGLDAPYDYDQAIRAKRRADMRRKRR